VLLRRGRGLQRDHPTMPVVRTCTKN
jgi:hypothetical protein